MSSDSDFQEVIRSSFWLYVGVAIFNIVGFLYWIIVSLFVSPDAVGTSSAILSLESLIINVFSLGIPMGIRRFIGKFWKEKESMNLSSYLSVSISFSLITFVPIFFIVILLSLQNFSLMNLNSMELFFTGILILFDFWPSVYASLFISVFRTKVTTLSNSVSSIVKIITGVILLEFGFGLIAILMSIIFASISRGVILLGYSSKLSNELEFKIRFKIEKQPLKEILSAGTASWIPNTLLVAGQAVGILLIYSYVGSTETGLYYIAFAISTALYHVPISIQSLMFPLLSGMENHRKEAVKKSIHLSLAVVMPFVMILLFYSWLPFVFLGTQYASAGEILAILMLGLIAFPVVSGYSTYVYAIGKYPHVIVIDTTSTIVRLVLYFLLILPFEGLGAAIAYVAGIFIAVVPILISARKTSFSFDFLLYMKVIVLPLLFSILTLFLDILWIIEVPVILFATFISYTRMGIITKQDFKQMALAFLSPESVAKVHTHTKRIVMFLFGD